MSDLIIKIGDDELDLSVDQTIAITKQAAKVGDFSTVLADGTNEVTVPLTPNNKTILDNAHLIESDSNKPYGRLEATLIQEGYETIQDGYAIVKSSSNNFSLQVVGGNASFFDLIRDLELRDLPLSDYDHFWTNQEVFDRRNETDGLIYAVFEQSMDDFTMDTYSSTPNDRFAVNTDQILPSFYVKTLVEKIFEEQGYTFVTDLSTEDIYTKAVVFRAETPDRGEDMSYHNCTVRNDATYFVTNASTRNFPTSTIDANDSEYLATGQVLSEINTNGIFPLTDSCRVKVSFNILYDSPYDAPQTDFFIRTVYTTNNGLQSVDTPTQTLPDGVGTYTGEVEFDCSMFEDEIYFLSVCVSSLTPSLEILEDSTFTVEVQSLLSNSELKPSTFPFNYITGAVPVPEMKQGEFLKELARIYQWVFDTDERTKTVTARRFDEIKENIPEALDLSDKLHVEDIQIKYGVDGFAQTNALRYQEDDESKYDAVGYIDVADTTLKAETDYVKMEQFAASSTRTRFVNVAAPYVPIFDEGLPSNGLTDRIFLVRRENPFDENVNFSKVGDPNPILPTDDLTFAYFAEAGNEDSLDFPTLIDRFYQSVIDINEKGKTVECKMNLNIKDVENYDPFKPVYISHFGNYFYWEKVSNYVKDKLTKCIFVRI